MQNFHSVEKMITRGREYIHEFKMYDAMHDLNSLHRERTGHDHPSYDPKASRYAEEAASELAEIIYDVVEYAEQPQHHTGSSDNQKKNKAEIIDFLHDTSWFLLQNPCGYHSEAAECIKGILAIDPTGTFATPSMLRSAERYLATIDDMNFAYSGMDNIIKLIKMPSLVAIDKTDALKLLARSARNLKNAHDPDSYAPDGVLYLAHELHKFGIHEHASLLTFSDNLRKNMAAGVRRHVPTRAEDVPVVQQTHGKLLQFILEYWSSWNSLDYNETEYKQIMLAAYRYSTEEATGSTKTKIIDMAFRNDSAVNKKPQGRTERMRVVKSRIADLSS